MHVAIIPDGNRRWAKLRNLPIEEGYRRGIEKFGDLIKWCNEFKIKYLSIWIFSSENVSRNKEEIRTLFKLFRETLKKIKKESKKREKENVRIRFVGDLSFFPKDIRKRMKEIEKKTEKNNGLQVILLSNYGGRKEILHAIKKILEELKKGKRKRIKIDENSFRKYLYAPDVPDPDMIIRTSEKRLSGLYVWQGAYSEIFFFEKLWPDFTKDDFEKALKDFEKRERRFGR